MNGTDAKQLSSAILATVVEPGQLKNWLQDQSTSDPTAMAEACVLATEELLGSESPKTVEWEQLLIQLAFHSHQAGLFQCRAALAKLEEMIEANRLASVDHEQLVTIAGALTIALTAQRKLRQPIENVMRLVCEQADNELEQIGQRCQDIWIRKGQMSGEPGLFLWDTRNSAWRLRQDFKAQRPGQ